MASWHENQYQSSIGNVNLNEPLNCFRDESEWLHFNPSNHHLVQHQEAQHPSFNGYIVEAAPIRQMLTDMVPSMLPMEMAISFTSTGMEPRSRARKDAEETMDQKQKRIIKNRESAARSRARKLAYQNELENKIICLEEELEMLKQQMEKGEPSLPRQHSNGAPIRRANSGPY